MDTTKLFHVGDVQPGRVPGMQWPRPVHDVDHWRVGWIDSDWGPAILGSLTVEDLRQAEEEGRFVDDPEETQALVYADGTIDIVSYEGFEIIDTLVPGEDGAPRSTRELLAHHGWIGHPETRDQGYGRESEPVREMTVAGAADVWHVHRKGAEDE
jgi:hypothetical protein